ncbi:MAG: hypothetical protein AUK47_16350 [Deltaproteobacteria bacterium CG2_30_63_29]|nr:MAG: hypothetical protein AUK47_16350 [Deltaproteobacteria bacterium CG2_30_63_29]PIW00836.1 MAG: hypothetical protein COW42_06685 [Deltaproteobacteria bacterium CG17_big_fil_post_rev_8_21_14_2_50_63_7]PJB34711.1 MAG: hypothetical protein CO108_27485 [Deltaproteobacteria bacterium CG_4_9_14_3_um_filter_63_12]
MLLLLLVPLSIYLQDSVRSALTPAADWQAAAAAVRAEYQPDDVIRVIPIWSDDVRVFLDGAQFDLSPEPRTDTLDRYKRIWLVAGLGRGEEAVKAIPERYTLVEQQSFGNVVVARFDVPPTAKPKYDFLEHVADAEVSRLAPSKPAEPCTLWRKDAWHCGRFDKHLNVGVRVRDMNNEARTCIYAPPVPEYAWLEIEFDDVPIDATLIGRVGMDNKALRSTRGSVTEFELLVDGAPLMHLNLLPRDPEFKEFSVDTSTLAGKAGKVTFRVRAKDFFDRFLCFTAQVPSP